MGFILLGGLLTVLIVYNNQLLFYFQLQRLREHLSFQGKVYQPGGHVQKQSFCSSAPYSKLWVHRVNTLERFLFLSKHFHGFEMDIVFNEQTYKLEVRHPPATSIGLSFEQYLALPQSAGKNFWLDVKNLSNVNEGAILKTLMQLDDQYAIRKRLIIESNQVLPLSRIADAGYFTSYYYDPDSYSAFLSSLGDSERDSIFSKIDAVSQDALIYDTLVSKFPSKPRLTWALSIKNYFSDELFTSLDQDDRLLVYLANVKSPGYR